jgi:hypothetical protein
VIVSVVVLMAIQGLLDSVSVDVDRQLLLLVHVNAAIAHGLNDFVEGLLVHLLWVECSTKLFGDSLQIGMAEIDLSGLLVSVLLSPGRLATLVHWLGLGDLLLERFLEILQIFLALGD